MPALLPPTVAGRWCPAAVALAGLLLAPACLTDTRASRDRNGLTFSEGAPLVRAPTLPRCEALGRGSARPGCDDAYFLARLFARRLSPGDAVCLEGGLGEEPGPACQVRAAVVDTGPDKVLLEVREAQPDSRWSEYVQHQVWFEEGALVDLYLAERGY